LCPWTVVAGEGTLSLRESDCSLRPDDDPSAVSREPCGRSASPRQGTVIKTGGRLILRRRESHARRGEWCVCRFARPE